MSKAMNPVDWIAYMLLVVGGINWGLIGLFDFNLVTTIFGDGALTMIVYSLVGFSGLYALWMIGKLSKR